ncbi:hypothetical protein F5141DRAFT_1185131 [Pisolithus sp. B1]|nr:hypothetical protein F5141DRAFT_1185131 [Pisolithus sp. B1]
MAIFPTLTRADDLWLASLNFLVLCVFIWQETTKYFGSPVDTVEAHDTASSARLWFALTIRQSCLMVVSGLTLLHIRMGHSVSFGAKQWMIWAPTLLLGIMSTVLAAVLSRASIPSLFIGLVAYSTMLSAAAFGGLVYTLVSVCHNLTTLHELANSWPPAKETLAPKLSFWFSCPLPQDPSVPPVPPLPLPYHSSTSPTCAIGDDPDPFCHDIPSRPCLGSQSSWLTSSTGTHPMMSAWSFRTAHQVESTVNISTPAALLTAQVLGGYGYTADSEKGITSLATKGSGVEISYARYMSWLLSIWVPMALSLPYLISLSTPGFVPSDALSVLLVLLVTLSSPLLVINILLCSPILIPTGLFDIHVKPPPAVVLHAPSPADTLAMYVRDYKGSGSVTIVKGHHSGDVWISQGDAVDGKGKVGWALGLMSSIPRLAVLPISEEKDEGEHTPPLPMQDEPSFPSTLPLTPPSTNKLKALSHLSTGEEMYALRIMIAQRHYSTLATTVVILASPERQEDPVDAMTSIATGVAVESSVAPGGTSHLHIPPPSDPLPLTLPNIHNVKLTKQLMHKKSYSSGFSLGAVVSEDMNEIDMLPAGVLPLLVPSLKVSEGMKIKEWEFSPPLSSTVARKPCCMPKESNGSDFGVLAHEEFSKISAHKRNHFSLPSLSLGKDALQSWKSEVNWALANKIHQYLTLPVNDNTWRNTVWGAHPCTGESQLQVPTSSTSLSHSLSTCILGLHPKVPHSMDSTCTSVITLASNRVE